MKLSRGTVEVLKNFSSMNKTVMIESGNIIQTISEGKSVLVKVALNDVFPSRGGIFDLSKFLGALSLYSEPELDFTEHHVDVGGDSSRVSYIFAAPEMILSPDTSQMSRCENLFSEAESVDLSFDLTYDQFGQILRGSGVMGLPDVLIRVQDENHVELEALTYKYRDSSDKFNMGDVECVTSCPPGTEFRFSLKNLQLLPLDYNINISNIGITRFLGMNTTDICEGATYYIAVER